jgi:pyruvyltransferase
MRLHWCRGCGPGGRNFGDTLGPILVRELAGLPVEWAPIRTAQAVTVGSIISRIPPKWRGTVLGTGTIAPYIHRDLSRARVLAVRGELTRKACGLPARVPLGDPGILVTDLYPEMLTIPSAIDVAIAPHYVDDRMSRRYPDALRISPLAGHRAVVEAIAGAKLLLTSSLHMLIAADALGVPHMVEPHPRVLGGLHKFADYCSAFGETIEPGVPRLTNRAAMAERQAELRSLFTKLR